MNKKMLKTLKIISIMCVVILFLELCYMIYKMFYTVDDKFYFDSVNSLVITENGYIGVGGNNDNDKYYEKAKITGYNNKREKTFEKLYNKGYLSSFSGVDVDDDSYIAVGGYEKEEVNYEQEQWSALIVKYDLEGNIIWEKDFQIADSSFFNSVKVVNDGYIVVGQSNFKKKNSSLDGGGYIIKYSKEGKIIWKKNFGSNTNCKFNDLLISDNIYVVGVNNNTGILLKYDLEGNLVADNFMENILENGFTGITKLQDSIYVVGSKKNSDNENAIIAKYDLNCEYINFNIKEGIDKSRYNQIISDDESLIVIGIQYNIKSKQYDGIIGKYNSNLEEVAIVDYGEDRDDFFTDILLDDSNYLVVGYSSYEDGGYLSKFINYSNALKVLEVG